MKGKITSFSQEKGFGFILGEDGQNYFFHTSDVIYLHTSVVSKNKMVAFTPNKGHKGLFAKGITIKKDKKPQQNNCNINKSQKQQKQSQPKKKKFVRIADITVNLNDVKSAEVHGNWKNAKLLIKTYSSGVLISYYNSTYNCEYGTNRDANNQARDDLEKLLIQL